MQYHEFPPSPFLSQVVRYFWIIEHRDDVPGQYRLLAESSPSLVFFPHADQCLLAGHTFSAQEISISGKFLMVGACLYPYAIPLLYSIPARTFRNTQVPFSELEHIVAPLLCEQMREASSLHARMKILVNYLEEKTQGAEVVKRSLHGCVQSMVHAGGQLSVDYVTNQLNLSGRQTQRNFREYVGCSPKQFSRLLRFHTSLRLSPQKKASLTDIAYHCGYADQSHFIREFREFSGMSPKKYFTLQHPWRADNFIRLA